jgi:hypothetical protein
MRCGPGADLVDRIELRGFAHHACYIIGKSGQLRNDHEGLAGSTTSPFAGSFPADECLVHFDRASQAVAARIDWRLSQQLCEQGFST